MEPLTPTEQQPDNDLGRLDSLAQLLDNRFRIPGTNFRFGLDAIIGLVPMIGDFVGLALAGYLFTIMARRGAGPLVMLRMLFNVLADAAVGLIPFLGDLFDFGFKANTRNVMLLKDYYAEGKKRPHIGWSLAFFAVLLLAFAGGVIWLVGMGFSQLIAMLGV